MQFLIGVQSGTSNNHPVKAYIPIIAFSNPDLLNTIHNEHYSKSVETAREIQIIYSKAFKQGQDYINNNFEEYEIQYFQDLKTAFQSADCISLNLPKVEKPIITRENSKYLKHGVIIVNTARGGLIEDNVLLDGIQKGTIAGVGLDVFDNEPLEKNHSLFKYKQVVFTPHQAGLSQESAERMSIKSIQNILDYFDGTLDESLVVNGVHL